MTGQPRLGLINCTGNPTHKAQWEGRLGQHFNLVREFNASGISVLMVEQNARQALAIAHWAYLLETGRVVESGPAAKVAAKDNVKEIFLGGHA